MVRGNTVKQQESEARKGRCPVKSVVSSQLSLWATDILSQIPLTRHMRGQSRWQGPEKAKKCRLWQLVVSLEGTKVVVRTRGYSKTLTVSVTIAQVSFEDVPMSVLLGIKMTS